MDDTIVRLPRVTTQIGFRSDAATPSVRVLQCLIYGRYNCPSSTRDNPNWVSKRRRNSKRSSVAVFDIWTIQLSVFHALQPKLDFEATPQLQAFECCSV